MDGRQLKDPAAGVPGPLLGHLHLVSSKKYPLMPSPPLDTIVHWLTEAPKVMRESPVQWQLLETPQDGSLFLVWQPAEYTGMNFASDGYVWTDPEQPFNSDVRGYTLQMLWHRAGYNPKAENVAAHARRRYRLLPTNQMGMPQPDPNFWLVHYSKASPRDQQPVTLQMPPQVAQQLQLRQMIQRSGGHLPRKEFSFTDRSQWPVINLPASLPRTASGPQMNHRRAQSLTHEASLEEEEDVSRGDVLDFMTPRDISRMRYEQHHEWMEEILESPYATKHIVPSELGLGRKGPLESLTNGFFTAPTSATHDPVNGNVGKLAPGRTDEFTRHANAKLAEMQAELEKMKTQHLRRMEKLRRTTDLGVAERKLRNMNVADDSYKTVAAQVQDLVGRQIEPVSKIKTVSRGGLQDIRPIVHEPQPQPQPQPQAQPQVPAPASQTFQQNPQNQNSAVQQQPQQSQQQQPPQTEPAVLSPAQGSQAQNQPQPIPTSQPLTQTQASAAETTGSSPALQEQASTGASSKPPTPGEEPSIPIENNDALDHEDDIDMGDLDSQDLQPADNNGEADDWDMVAQPIGDMLGNDSGQVSAQDTPGQQSLDQPTPANERQEIQPVVQSGTNTPGNEFDMVTDFDNNMDTAGDALADYTAGGDDDDLGLDDSAFGDAFHHNQQDMS